MTPRVETTYFSYFCRFFFQIYSTIYISQEFNCTGFRDTSPQFLFMTEICFCKLLAMTAFRCHPSSTRACESRSCLTRGISWGKLASNDWSTRMYKHPFPSTQLRAVLKYQPSFPAPAPQPRFLLCPLQFSLFAFPRAH